MIAEAAMPYLLAGALTAGLAMGGTGAWKWQASRVQSKQNEIDQITGAIARATWQAESKAEVAQVRVDSLTTALDQSYLSRKTEYVETIREIQTVASPTNVCLGPRVIRVLQRAQDRGNAKDQGPVVVAGLGSGATTDPGGSASEAAMSEWLYAGFKQFKDVRDKHRTLSGIVRVAPCIEVVN